MFRTEFSISMQSGRDEEIYFDKLHEVLSSLISEEDKISGRLFDVNYLPTKKMNQIGFYWKMPKAVAIPDQKDWHPEGFLRNCQSPKEGIELECVRCMEASLKKIKWLKKHCICNVATMWM